jgi:hypothetical protein
MINWYAVDNDIEEVTALANDLMGRDLSKKPHDEPVPDLEQNIEDCIQSLGALLDAARKAGRFQ